MLSDSDRLALEQKKLEGSKRFGCLWACIIFLASFFLLAETDTLLPLIGAGLLTFFLFLSIGNQRRMGILLTTTFFTSAVMGTVYWSLWAVPVAFGLVLIMASTYARWISDPLLDMISQKSDEGNDSPKEVAYEGGNGSSLDKAVVITGAQSSSQGVNAEYKYISQMFGEREKDWTLDRQTIIKTKDGRRIDKIVIEKESKKYAIFFDISDFYDKY